ncbi:phage tail protein [Pseudonocardia xinjiangensis]|jgi:phage tail-like protein|uniref:Phage tail protein n=1 Tax=Pseudonocardia xinjiangensis TaxID=75289 RepID=A0ABX1RNV4_9PSEU|nr:phage tail protein [Pseudonocardia xinjiangensis]NMH81667.1 phage tail protein [Pseudonocardia xinjiangensis]
MSLQPGDAYVAHQFTVDIDGIQSPINKIGEMKYSLGVVEYQQVDQQGKPLRKKMPGAPEGGTVTVTRGLDDQSTQFDTWIDAAMTGDMSTARKNVSLVVNDYTGQEKMRWNLTNAWVSSVTTTGGEAGSASPFTQDIEINWETMNKQNG